MASAALQAIRRRVTIDWRELSQQQAKELLLRTAREGHAKIMREQSLRSGVVPEWSAYANSPGNTNLESVRLPGPIVYTYRYRREIVLVAMKELYAASPVDSGLYRKSHTLFLNGLPAAASTPIKPGVDVWLANPVPYARRLEIGKTESGRDFLVSVPNRIYERVAKKLQTRYRNAASIRFGYITVPNAYIIKGRLAPSYAIGGGKRRKRRQQTGKPVRAPAIFIEALS